jgi:hypothetical protein
MYETQRLEYCIQQDHDSARRSHTAKNKHQTLVLLKSKKRNIEKQKTVLKYVDLVEKVINQFEIKLVMGGTFEVLNNATGSILNAKSDADKMSISVDGMIQVKDTLQEQSDMADELMEDDQAGGGYSDDALFAEFQESLNEDQEESIPTSAVVPRYSDSVVVSNTSGPGMRIPIHQIHQPVTLQM